jgi:glycosyltransferase involved in cell wall biosynthesis
MPNNLVSLIIPAFNEEKTVGAVIDDAAEIMNLYGFPYEIIVVNDGSTDKTELAALSTHKAKVLSNKLNHGKGYCVRRGIKHAHGEILVTLDSDGEHKPKEIPDLINPLFEGCDVVSGSRFISQRSEVTTKINQVGNFLFNSVILAITGRQVTDSQTGFRAMKREVVDQLNLQSNGYEIETEITVKSLMNGFRFKEVPITIERRKYSMSKIKILSDGKKILTTIVRSTFSQLGEDHKPQSPLFENFSNDLNKTHAGIMFNHSKVPSENIISK